MKTEFEKSTENYATVVALGYALLFAGAYALVGYVWCSPCAVGMKTDKKNFELVRFEAIPDENGDAKDWVFTVIATGKSESTLLKYAKMKGLSMNEHTIDYVGPDED